MSIFKISKLVIPVHVSMEESAMKRKVDKGTSVNAVVDGKETIAKTRLIQVRPKFRNVLHYTFVAYVYSTVQFFPKLVIPVHVSMEEPVLKTKAEKSTSVNAVVDGKETIAKIRLMQVPLNLETFFIMHMLVMFIRLCHYFSSL